MSKVRDGIIGHAIGDAMGVPVEFAIREKLLKHPVTKMLGYGSHDVPEGSWSDDTTMEICLIESYIENKEFDLDSTMNKWIDWVKNGAYTPTGELFDIGRTCLRAIRNYEAGLTKAEESGGKDINSNGNGSLMRILPVAYYINKNKMNERETYELVKKVSSMTHAHEISILGCYIYILYVNNLLNGKDKFASYNMIKIADYSMFTQDSLDKYNRILKGNIKDLNINDISSSGYVLDTLEASLWVTLNANNYKESIIGAINLGNDTDTIGAITGSMTGIIYGYDSIPKEWLEKLQRRDYLEKICEDFERTLVEEV